MNVTKLFFTALVLAAGLLMVPWLLPQGPSNALNAEAFLRGGQFFFASGVIFLGGLLTSLTPCVYPLIPITVSVFGARKAESRLEAVGLTSSYVVGMGMVFSLLGVLAALSGKAFGSALGNPWVVAGLAVFLLVLASSMFGAFELALPSSLASKLNHVGGSGFFGAFLMGSVSGFLAAPCTGPVLTGVLTFVATSQSPVLGAALLFVYALGVGVPFFLLGVFTVRLPKSGVWMEWVKSIFGIALLSLAATYLRDVWPLLREKLNEVVQFWGQTPAAYMAAFFVFVGVLMGAVHRSFKGKISDALWKGVGVLLVVFAVLVRASATHIAVDIWSFHFSTQEENASTITKFDEALGQAQKDGKPVMIDFFAEWCAACKELDQFTYSDDRVMQKLNGWVTIKVDSTEANEVTEKLWERFGIQGLPTVVFFNSRGEVIESARIEGFVGAQEFLRNLEKVH